MHKRQERDRKYLEALEDISQTLWRSKKEYGLTEESHPQALRLKEIEEKLTRERRIVEEISLPCRLILEHFSTFLKKSDHVIGFRLGLLEVGKGILNDFSIDEWGTIYLEIGNIRLGWHDKDYQYLFYPDKVILRSYDRSKPEIQLIFNFAFKYSKILPEFNDLTDHEQTLYCHPDMFELLEE